MPAATELLGPPAVGAAASGAREQPLKRKAASNAPPKQKPGQATHATARGASPPGAETNSRRTRTTLAQSRLPPIGAKLRRDGRRRFITLAFGFGRMQAKV